MPASAFAIEIGELIPSGIFLLLALVLPFVFYHVGGGFLHRLQKHICQAIPHGVPVFSVVVRKPKRLADALV